MEENRARQAREEGATGATNMDTSTAEPGTTPTGTVHPPRLINSNTND